MRNFQGKGNFSSFALTRYGIECAGFIRSMNDGDSLDQDVSSHRIVADDDAKPTSCDWANRVDSSIAHPSPQIHVVLLLIDQDENPQFELFHLEFAERSATVVDLLGQIPRYASNEILRKQAYQGVCNYSGRKLGVCSRLTSLKHDAEEQRRITSRQDGHKLTSSEKLNTHRSGEGPETFLAIAVPADMSVEDTIARSRVILRHPIVIHELELCGLDNFTLSSLSSAPLYQFVMVLLSQRSFELVHADVFHTDAKVSDVLALIPRSATQEEIRKQHYTGLYDISSGQCQSIGPHHRKENEVISVEKNALIRTVVGNKKNGVLVPMPANLLENECARRTRTILARPEIVEMLRSKGIEVPGNLYAGNVNRKGTVVPHVESSDDESTISVWLPRLCLG